LSIGSNKRGNRLKKILIVDDNPAVTEIVSELVSSSGYVPIVASGGREALQKVEAERPDLILLDINMPDMDGWTVLRQLKEKGFTDTIKIMMLTATTEIGTDIFGLQDVVFGYIRKPFNNAELSERLKDALEDNIKPVPEPLPVHEEKKQPGRFRLFGKPAPKEPTVTDDGMEKAKKSAKEYDLRKGFAYLVREVKPNKSFDIFTDQVTHNIQGLCVTRQHPSTIRKEWGLEKTPIIWLSNQLGKVYVNPTNIGILSDTIIRFVEKSGDSVVLIDGVEFLIVNNDFEKVLRMIHHITEAVMEYKSRLIISVDPRTLSTRELALLERNMEIIDEAPPEIVKPEK
jgi:DNA-binding response OmpR family regulator